MHALHTQASNVLILGNLKVLLTNYLTKLLFSQVISEEKKIINSFLLLLFLSCCLFFLPGKKAEKIVAFWFIISLLSVVKA